MDTALKVREDRLRRAARRQGLRLHKSRTRDPRALDFERWYISDPTTNWIVAGGRGWNGFDLSIDDVESYLNGEAGEAR
jgi:hypothetical protein